MRHSIIAMVGGIGDGSDGDGCIGLVMVVVLTKLICYHPPLSFAIFCLAYISIISHHITPYPISYLNFLSHHAPLLFTSNHIIS